MLVIVCKIYKHFSEGSPSSFNRFEGNEEEKFIFKDQSFFTIPFQTVQNQGDSTTWVKLPAFKNSRFNPKVSPNPSNTRLFSLFNCWNMVSDQKLTLHTDTIILFVGWSQTHSPILKVIYAMQILKQTQSYKSRWIQCLLNSSDVACVQRSLQLTRYS